MRCNDKLTIDPVVNGCKHYLKEQIMYSGINFIKGNRPSLAGSQQVVDHKQYSFSSLRFFAEINASDLSSDHFLCK